MQDLTETLELIRMIIYFMLGVIGTTLIYLIIKLIVWFVRKPKGMNWFMYVWYTFDKDYYEI